MAGDTVCKYFIQGKCHYGDACRYQHPGIRGGGRGYGDRAGRQSDYSSGNERKVCQHYLRGNCTYGYRCKFQHENPRTGYAHAQFEQQGPSKDNVCKHYLNGSCRFGDNCKFEHPSSGWSSGGQFQGGHHNSSRPAFNSTRNTKGSAAFHFSELQEDVVLDLEINTQTSGKGVLEVVPSSQQPTTGIMPGTPQEAVKMIHGDISEWKASHMWPLSCYGFYGWCLPELKDISPEELRWEAYTSDRLIYIQAERALSETQSCVQSQYHNASTGDTKVLLQTVMSFPPFAGTTLFASSPLYNSSQGSFSTASSRHQLGSLSSSSQSASAVPNPLGTAPHPMLGISNASAAQAPGGDIGTKPSTGQCTQEELAVYHSDTFMLGQIPEHAPPASVC